MFTEYEYCLLGVLGSIVLFFAAMAVIFFLKRRIFRLTVLGAAVLTVAILAGTIVLNLDEGVEYRSPEVTAYKGVPIPFFDFVVYPSGYFHLIDKKKYFRSQDKKYMLEHEPDIMLIGAGADGSGGQGFDLIRGTYFMFNQTTLRGTQVIILPTPEACKVYNRLRSEGKAVFFAVHNG